MISQTCAAMSPSKVFEWKSRKILEFFMKTPALQSSVVRNDWAVFVLKSDCLCLILIVACFQSSFTLSNRNVKLCQIWKKKVTFQIMCTVMSVFLSFAFFIYLFNWIGLTNTVTLFLNSWRGWLSIKGLIQQPPIFAFHANISIYLLLALCPQNYQTSPLSLQNTPNHTLTSKGHPKKPPFPQTIRQSYLSTIIVS